jgi:hypothetical protein
MKQETGVKTTMEMAEMRWRRYPHIDAALETAKPALLANIQQTQSKIDRILQHGNEREKERARAAQLAYLRALAIYQDLVNLRDTSRDTASNKRTESAITG